MRKATVEFDMEVSKPKSLGLRFAAYLCSALALFNPVAPTLANILEDVTIEQDLNENPLYLKTTGGDYQFNAPQFIEWPSSGTKSLESVYQELLREHSSAISPPTYVPIGVGGITTFIPTYTRYKYVGTPAVQARYVRTQIVSLLGRNIFKYASEAEQLNALYSNAVTYAKEHGVRYGVPLFLDQNSSGLDQDMIWPELREINGQAVIVPVVYLTASTVSEYKVVDTNQQIPKTTRFGSLTVYNSDLKTERDTFLEVAGNLNVLNGSITGDGALKILALGKFDNASSIVSATGDLEIGAKSIDNRTIVYRYDLGHEQGTRYGEIASIASTNGDVVLKSHSDIQFNGADASAQNGSLTLAANGHIKIGTQQLYSGSTSRYGNGTQARSQVSYLQSHLTAEETIKLVASGQIVIDAAEIVSDSGHIELLAGMGISVIDAMGVTQSQASGKFGKKKVDESIYQTVAIRTLLDAGKGIKLNTDFGDITLRAADITSGEGTQVSAKNGAVNLLMTTETDHYSYSSVKKGTFTTKTVSKGRNIETGVPNSIVGGFAVEALNGITVEYEGDPNLNLDEQLDVIAEMDGMSWINDVRNSPDVDWNAIALAHEEWYEKNTSLSPAFAAVVAIAVAVATGGAGAAAASAIGATGTAGTIVAAGVSSFISQATMAVANGAVNGDIGGALEGLASSDTLKSLAVSMVTAGAIAQVDAAFFNVDTASIGEAGQAVESAATVAQAQAGVDAAINTASAASTGMSLTSQVMQAVTHATVQAGAQAVIAGADFEEGFVQALVSNSLAIVGEKLAGKIGAAKRSGDINTATQLVAHAAVGCLTGSISAASTGGDGESGCASGAGGAVVGELIGLAYAEDLESDLNDWVKEQVAEGKPYDHDAVMQQALEFKARGVDMAKLGAALTAFAAGGDVDIAAVAGQNAAENNGWSLAAILAVVTVVVAIANTSYVSIREGGLHEGLQSIGRGDDPVSQALNSAVEAGAELAADRYPEKTQAVAEVLEAAGEKVAAGVKIFWTDTATGETVTRYWNEIPQEQRDAIVGGATVVTMVIPPGVVAKLKTLGNLEVPAGDWIKDPKHKNWDSVSEQDKQVLYSEYVIPSGGNSSRNPLLEDSLPRNGNRMVLDQGPAPTCGHNACAMTLDSLGHSVDPARLIERLPPSIDGIDGKQLERLFYKEGVLANFVPDRTIDRVEALTDGSRPIVVRIEGEGSFSHWVVVDGVTTRQGKKVVAIRDSAGGKQYFSPIETFEKWFTGEVVIPNP